MAALTIDSMEASGALAPELTNEIFRKVREDSLITRVAGTTPMSITGNQYVIRTAEPEADIVPEASPKPVSDLGYATKTVTPVKAATIVYWSKEARIANPGGVFNDIQESMARAIQRQIDLAVLHGKSAKSGAVIPGVEYVNQTANRVTLGTAASNAGGLTADLASGYGLITDAGYEFDGFLADPRFRSSLMTEVDANGAPRYGSEVNLASGYSNVLGLPAYYGRAVSGQIASNTDTNVRAFGGDFARNLKLGFVENITFSRTNTATIVDGDTTVPLWQNNMEAALVEAIFGWVLHDTDAFVAYEGAATAPAA